MRRSPNPVIVIGRSSKRCVRRPKPQATSPRMPGSRPWLSSPAVNGSQPTGTTPAFLGLPGEVRFDLLAPRSNAGSLSVRFRAPQRTVATNPCRIEVTEFGATKKLPPFFGPRNFLRCLAFPRCRSSPSSAQPISFGISIDGLYGRGHWFSSGFQTSR
jgi:hypothetical protein